MKLVALSDIHGNAQALHAVLEALECMKIDRVVCLGDVVGYGPSPVECVETVRERGFLCVLGNHDQYVSQASLNEQDWNIRSAARESILWTRSVLDEDHIRWLAGLARIAKVAEGTLQGMHSSPLYWPRWRYLDSPEKAAPAFLFQRTRIGFIGHTHVPCLATHSRGTSVTMTRLKSGRIPASGPKMLINVGAVGQPRDADPRACATWLDTETRDLRVIRVPYDVAETQRRLRQAGLPESLAVRLEKGL